MSQSQQGPEICDVISRKRYCPVVVVGSCVEYNAAEVRKTTARIMIIGQNTNLFALKETACFLVG